MPALPSPAPDAHLIEIFSSIQGEGPWVGVRQIFIRFGGCNWACSYCDTGVEALEYCKVEKDPGSGKFKDVANPVSLSFVAELVASWKVVHPRAYHSISLTGGEPLIHEHVLLEWLPKLREFLPIYLETNGTLPETLKKFIPHLDFIAMDIKLSTVTGMPTPWDDHRRFLELAAHSRCCVKVVVGRATSEDELIRAASMVRTVAPETVLVLQPLSAKGKVTIPADKLLRMQELAAGIHGDVRVIPQNHHILKLL
ncbi:MAG: 7-carboxy-7-deazaguanine synthase QueE [Deltaproteobacteria bacterium]|nr:7-carboxy-7-deazaguanine synthase QueE [Deltaproteobacteria bacterium]